MTGRPTVLYVRQGEVRVSDQASACFSTVLGSCVAACMYDPIRRIGGMNHFLLPGADPKARDNIKYGLHLMEQLINTMMREGALKSRLRVHLFGGANVMPSLTGIGDSNASFARKFVADEHLTLAGADLGGTLGRRVHFEPDHGKVSVRLVKDFMRDEKPPQAPRRRPDRGGTLELF